MRFTINLATETEDGTTGTIMYVHGMIARTISR